MGGHGTFNWWNLRLTHLLRVSYRKRPLLATYPCHGCSAGLLQNLSRGGFSLGVRPDSSSYFASQGILNLFGGVLIQKKKAEEALEASGMQYTIVRCARLPLELEL